MFPECAVSGYVFGSKDEARRFAHSVPGPETCQIQAACRRSGCFAVVGMLERDESSVYNTAAFLGPSGVLGIYRKVHLPFLGADRFVDYGDRPFGVHAAGDVKIGMNICYDANFPEAARCLALLGADVIVLPTNWVDGPGSRCTAEHVVNARAADNAVYYIAVNRIGTERGFTFMGQSKIVAPDGRTLAVASPDSEEILFAEIDTAASRNKYVIRIPGEHESHRFADRRPEKYTLLTERHSLRGPRQLRQ